MSWRTGALLREAGLNVETGFTRTAVLTVLVAAALGLLAFVELRQAADIAAFQREFEAAGGYVAVVSGGQGEQIEAGRCDALNAEPWTVAAGGVRILGTVSLTATPDVIFQSAVVTGRAIEVWAPGATSTRLDGEPGFVVGAALAKEAGVREGSFLSTRSGETGRVGAVIDTERRNPRAQRWLLTQAPPEGPIDECWIEFSRATFAPGMETLGAWFSQSDKEPVVRPYIRRDEFSRDVRAEFASRPQRWGWVAAGGFMAMVFLLVSWFRRADLGLYLALGTGRGQLLTMLGIEVVLVTAIGLALGSSWALALRALADDPLPWDHVLLGLRSAGMGALLGLALAPFTSLLSARGNLAAMLKDR